MEFRLIPDSDNPHAIPPLFEARLRPHRSLSNRGMVVVLALIFGASLMITGVMALLGAWPVIGFNGIDVALAGFLIWLNLRAARAVEIIRLGSDTLEVLRTDFRGRREAFSLAPYWLNIVLEERPGTVPRLLLARQGQAIEIGRALGAAEKRDLAAALCGALHRWRNPRFENPQL